MSIDWKREKMSEKFVERPGANEKLDALKYLDNLIDKINLNKAVTSLDKPNDLPALKEIRRLLNSKRYGLVWERHAEKVEEQMKKMIPVFIEDKEKLIISDSSKNFNFLLEGDNLHSLHLLEKTHRNSIDVIYIDPPYNTGNKDFKYNDTFVDNDDSFSHSKWLSFMERRLLVAKRLLTPNGIILVSIDNKEGYQLKILLDDIFGNENLAADLHVETSAIAGPRRFAAVNGSVVKNAEFVLAYTMGSNKKIMKRPQFDGIEGYDTHYSLFLDHTTRQLIPLMDVVKSEKKISNQFSKNDLRINRKNLDKLVRINDEIKNWLFSDEISRKIFRIGDKYVPKGLSESDYKKIKKIKTNSVEKIGNKFITLKSNGDFATLFRYKDRLGMSNDYNPTFGERTIRGNLWKGFSADGGNLKNEGGVNFKNGKKPLRLIKQLIKSVTTNDEKIYNVLDFFAGSGTTGQAVSELNEEGKGNYRFILATNDEVIGTTYKRMQNISEQNKLNLKYFKTDFINKNESEEDIENKLLSNVKSLIELENFVDLENSNIGIVVNFYDIDRVNLTKIQIVYMREQVHNMMKKSQIIEYSDTIIYDIPEHYFNKELRELGL